MQLFGDQRRGDNYHIFDDTSRNLSNHGGLYGDGAGRSYCSRSVAHSAVAVSLCEKKETFKPDLVYCLPRADPAGSGDCHDCLRWQRLRIDTNPTVKSDA